MTLMMEPVMSTTDSADLPVIELVHPMPGFPDRSRFALVSLDEDGVLCALRSLEEPDLRFLVVPPGPFFPDYAPEVDDSVVSDLGIDSADDALVLLVLRAGTSLAETTANLLAPVVVNRRTRRAAQVILDDPSLSVSAPLVA
ncbi:flagellar assembly factor FliW [Nocardioides lianchengensis]|uniref:Flagellar assembly factor FliW n=2 Tax=Nocardioidaceae TaxID=85015 RepID=A0A1G6U3H7_9ACTN|nr:flagellar assembly factor FliW [Nocardioides lianchengensis]